MIRPIHTLTLEEIRQVAREQADSGDALHHGFPSGSRQAIAFELAYMERRLEVETVEG